MPMFTASRISSDANVLYPDIITIDDYNVTFYKGRPFGYETVIVPRRAIVGVSIDSGLWFADVVISSMGATAIVAHGFKKSVAKKIVNLLT